VWLAASKGLAEGRANPDALVRRVGWLANHWCGYGKLKISSSSPVLKVAPDRSDASDTGHGIAEGRPCMKKSHWHALGLFDEFFIGWGGNGHELSNRLGELNRRGVMDWKVLATVRLSHQPHKKDQCKRDKQLVALNQRYRHKRLRDARSGAPWFMALIRRLQGKG